MVERRLARSPLFRPGPGRGIHVYVGNRRWRFAQFANVRSQVAGLAYVPWTDRIHLRAVDFSAGRLIGPSGKAVQGERTLAYFLAHEIIHVLIAKDLGAGGYLRLPRWKDQGYSDSIDRGAGFPLRARRRQAPPRDGKMNPRGSGLYLRYHLLVAHLLDRERIGPSEMLAGSHEPGRLEAILLEGPRDGMSRGPIPGQGRTIQPTGPPPMRILFPSDPREPERPDPTFREEHRAAVDAGFPALLYRHEALVAGDASGVLADAPNPADPGGPILLRGWMLAPERYESLHRRLLDLGHAPTTDPDQYIEAHYLPCFYRHIAGHTAESAWCEGDDVEDAWRLYQRFRDADALIKDFAKSAKHRWDEACFLPAGTDADRFVAIFRAFRAARSRLFQRGVVLRRFLPLVWRGRDMRGFPIAEEYRLFFFRGNPLILPANCPDDFEAQLPTWIDLASRFASRFLAMDVAPLSTGGWTVVEVGDGGVSGLPMSLPADDFYRALRTRSDGPEITSLGPSPAQGPGRP